MDVGVLKQFLVITAFVVGAAGNTAALWILYKSSKTRNPKHVLLLRCLVMSDLVAQLGMLVLMKLPKHVDLPAYWRCTLYVILRAFGLGSGCVALIMAGERLLALTKPFLYQQYVTKRALMGIVLVLWTLAALLTCSPLLGFGLFYADGKCFRYREAKEAVDVVYAYVFLIFGFGLCSCIVYCNVTVFCAVAHIGARKKKLLIRRVSKSSIARNRINTGNFATTEELAFAKLIAVISIAFILCWMPQLVCIPLAQFFPATRLYETTTRVADILMSIYFTFDPYIYVIYQYLEKKQFRLPCFSKQRYTSPDNTPTSELAMQPSFTIRTP